ncbi:uncharacterized protein LOC143842409 isoform X4 [Paroedura picta]|uniref:uncharacterized protein LOC143842409 isoform X4 n=1 Tax=Paroedura picta TaxID=143630 RepID=UPI0040567BB8
MEEKLILGVHTGLLTLPLVHFTTRTTKLQLSELTTSSVPTALQPFRNDLSLRTNYAQAGTPKMVVTGLQGKSPAPCCVQGYAALAGHAQWQEMPRLQSLAGIHTKAKSKSSPSH